MNRVKEYLSEIVVDEYLHLARGLINGAGLSNQPVHGFVNRTGSTVVPDL